MKTWILILFLSAFSQSVMAAFCSLRDPIAAIRTLYPASTTQQSIVKTIDQSSRDYLISRLPFALHFNELGHHTLYVSQHHEMPLGLVHVRSELAQWGFIEIAWALNLDLTIRDLYFQRCRSPWCNDDFRRRFLKDVKGQSFVQLASLLDVKGELVASAASRYQYQSSLAQALLRSALKTIAITEHTWHDEIQRLKRLKFVQQSLGLSDELALLTIDDAALRNRDLGHLAAIPKARFKIMQDNQELGRLVEASWEISQSSGYFAWIFAPDGFIHAIQHHDVLSHPRLAKTSELTKPLKQQIDVEQAFDQLVQTTVLKLEQCATAAELSAAALFHFAYSKEQGVAQ